MNELASAAARLALPTAGRHAGTDPLPRTDAWLREVERARWAAQPRYDAPQGGLSDSESTEPAAPPVGSRRVMPLGDNAETTGAASAAQAGVAGSGEERAATRSAASLQRMAEEVVMAGQAAVVGPVVSAAIGATLDTDSAAIGMTRATQTLAAATRDWQPRVMHVESSDGDVAVWLRDARVGAQEALQLLERLSRTFSSSPATAGALRLTVNGQPVHRADVPTHIQAQQERTSHGD